MAKNDGKRWNSQEITNLKKLAAGNTPTRVIGMKLGRTPGAIQAKASEKNISLEPHNRSPYGTKRG